MNGDPLNLNPLNLDGPSWSGNFIQPNTAAPAANPSVASSPVGVDELGLGYTSPPLHYIQPGVGNFPF